MTARMYYDNDVESSGRWLAGASPRPSESTRRIAQSRSGGTVR
jgi:hypothetical protein